MDVILISFNFNPGQVEIAHQMVLYMIPSLLVQSFNDMTRNFLVAQGISFPFVFLNI